MKYIGYGILTAVIAIAEQLEKMNDNVTDIGIVKGWWVLEDRLEHAIRINKEDKDGRK